MFSFKELKALYDKGVNISAYLRGEDSSLFNTPAIIEAAYERSLDYTVEKIYRYIQTDDESLVTWRNKHV